MYIYIYIHTHIYNSNPFPHKINRLAVLTLLLYPPVITKIKTYNIEMTLYIYYIFIIYISYKQQILKIKVQSKSN